MKKIKLLMIAVAVMACGTASAQFSNTSMRGSNKSGYQSESGYRGFVEVGYTVGTGDAGADAVSFTTSHGYQINPYVFVGAGAGVNYYHSPDMWSVPIFATARGTLIDGPISPFLDLKIGYAAADVSGFYFSPTIGCRFNKFTLSAGYQMVSVGSESESVYVPSYGYGYGGYYSDYETDGYTAGGFVFKVGLEF